MENKNLETKLNFGGKKLSSKELNSIVGGGLLGNIIGGLDKELSKIEQELKKVRDGIIGGIDKVIDGVYLVSLNFVFYPFLIQFQDWSY
ncbi:hypothetical protein OZ666_12755 [Elizabethkingia sp. HX QKY]|uniref:hypothetical protein n=1 Tax=Elizabethkingia TaxID=308865 RepID=UPI002A23AEBA|nr:hypothetical protein [Elizabethkingia sp. HX QKY]MDX8572559.1 hypothetical protein [Elizabethkingia sp. HX QKY]